RHGVRQMPRLHQGDGTDLRGELPDDQVTTEPDHADARLRRDRSGAVAGRHHRSVAQRRDHRCAGIVRIGGPRVMPQLLTVRVKRPDGRPIRIWVPVLPVVLVFSPVLVLALLVAAVACLVYRVSVIRAVGTGWRIISALPGTRVDVEQGRTAVLVTIR